MTSQASVLVTGSSSGIGRQIAETLARHDATVFASMRDIQGKNRQAAEELRQLAERERIALQPIELDVTDGTSVEAAVRTIIDRTGTIDVVVNNAAGGLGGLTEASTIEQVQRLFDANVFGALRVNQAVLPHMRRQQSGLLVYLSSTSSQIAVPFLAAYGATKAAIEALALCSRYEYFSLGIDTVVLQLGGYATKFGVNLQRPERAELNAEYGVAGQMAQGFADHMAVAMDHCDDPQQVARVVAELIDLPRGTRPAKITMGLGSEGLEQINQNLAAIQEQFIQGMGLGVLVSREIAQGA